MKKDFDNWNKRKKEIENIEPNFYYETLNYETPFLSLRVGTPTWQSMGAGLLRASQ